MGQRIRLTIAGLWLGAMAFFTTSVAQAAFAVLPTRRMAGDLVAPVLAHLEYVGLAASLLLILSLMLSRERRTRTWTIEFVLYWIAFVATSVARFYVAARIHHIRVEWGDKLETLASSDPVRSTFGMLHGISVGLMGIDMVVALVAIVLLLMQARDR